MAQSDGRRTFRMQHSFGATTPLPLDTLPPETLARLRAGGTLTQDDLAILQQAAVQGGSLTAKLAGALLASPLMEKGTAADGDQAATLVSGPDHVIATGPTRVFEWRLGGAGGTGGNEPAVGGASPVPEPATYYEAITGRPDPARDFFVNTRRTLNLIVTGLAIALPVGLTLLAILVGESFETIFFVAFGASLVGLMLKTSFPRTPFG